MMLKVYLKKLFAFMVKIKQSLSVLKNSFRYGSHLVKHFIATGNMLLLTGKKFYFNL